MSFDWTKINFQDKKQLRIATPYSAMSATERSDETYEEFLAITSGYNTRRAHELHVQSLRSSAIELWNIAGRDGFVDC